MICRRPLLLSALALALAQCGPKPPAVVTLTMIGGADQNPDAGGKAAPVAVRVYQLTQTAKFERGDVFALTEHEQQTLGQDDAGSQEFVLSPGETTAWRFAESLPPLPPLLRLISTALACRRFAPITASSPSAAMINSPCARMWPRIAASNSARRAFGFKSTFVSSAKILKK